MSTTAMQPVPKDAPVMLAWEVFKLTEEYAIARKWAAYPEHVDGSLWFAFYKAFPGKVDGHFLSTAAKDVLDERERQVKVEGWTAEHDDKHDTGDLCLAGSAYAANAGNDLNPYSQGDGDYHEIPPSWWPWDARWWKPKNPRRDLVRAAALILAEIERIDRAAVQALNKKLDEDAAHG